MSDHKSKPTRRTTSPLVAPTIRWRAEPTDDEYLAARKHLQLLLDHDIVEHVIENFRDAAAARVWNALILLYAANQPLLGRDDSRVAAELIHVTDKVKFSPVLFLRGSFRRPPTIVDGYHRVCAAYHLDPDVQIPVKLV